jgi:hypothetical protein
MTDLETYFHTDADEFGIRDGRVVAQRLVTDAVRFILPYVRSDPGTARHIMEALCWTAFRAISEEIDREGDFAYSIGYDDEKLKDRDLWETFVEHAAATKDITEAADRARRGDQHHGPARSIKLTAIVRRYQGPGLGQRSVRPVAEKSGEQSNPAPATTDLSAQRGRRGAKPVRRSCLEGGARLPRCSRSHSVSAQPRPSSASSIPC